MWKITVGSKLKALKSAYILLHVQNQKGHTKAYLNFFQLSPINLVLKFRRGSTKPGLHSRYILVQTNLVH